MDILKNEMVEYIIIHHSNKIFDHPLLIKLRHKFLRGWHDTGYHFIIGNGIFTKNGAIFSARPTKYVGAHALGYNKNSIGVCLIGNFDYCVPTFKQYRSLIRLLSFLKEKYHIPNDHILGHRETAECTKTCPGVFVVMDRIRRLV